MSIIITAPTVGSLKVANSSASPQNSYYCNLKTVSVQGDPFLQNVNVINMEGTPLLSIPVKNIALIGASASPFSLQVACDDIAALIITT